MCAGVRAEFARAIGAHVASMVAYVERRCVRLGLGSVVADDIDVGVATDTAVPPDDVISVAAAAGNKALTSTNADHTAAGAAFLADPNRSMRANAYASACAPLHAPPPRLFAAAGSALRSALDWHVEQVRDLVAFVCGALNGTTQGDIQTAAVVVLVLHAVGANSIDDRRRRRWLFDYVELLQRLQLHTHAIEVAAASGVSALTGVNKEMTLMSTACSRCGAGLYDNASQCFKCHSTTSSCALCRRPVRALFVYCQTCGHGGHATHMQQWFRDGRRLCATGCGHVCDLASGFVSDETLQREQRLAMARSNVVRLRAAATGIGEEEISESDRA
jgi:ribosomal protein L40E